MSEAKIRLSQTEMEMVCNAELILTKNRILQKVNQLLAGLQAEQLEYIQMFSAALPEAVRNSTAKISRGENYKGLPYLMLDHPRTFGKTDVLAVRTLFWWGNFFSVTLHLSGLPKIAAEEKIICAYPLLKEKGYFCCVHDDPWEHHFEPGNYIALEKMEAADFATAFRERPFIKLATRIQFDQWDDAAMLLMGYWEELMELVTG